MTLNLVIDFNSTEINKRFNVPTDNLWFKYDGFSEQVALKMMRQLT